MESIFKNYWLEIFHSDGIHIIRYNSGDLCNTIRERVVTKEEAMLAQRSDEAAMKILDKYDNIELFGEDYMNR